MKLSAKTYAKILISNSHGDKKALAKKFWFSLQRNKQYRDLPKIVNELDHEYARENNSIYAEIISENKLSNEEIKTIEEKLAKTIGKKIISKNIAKANFGPGIVVKTEEATIDISTLGKIENLKRALSN